MNRQLTGWFAPPFGGRNLYSVAAMMRASGTSLALELGALSPFPLGAIILDMQIDEVKSKLKRLTDLNPDDDYGVNPPLSLQEVEAFEKEHKIKLPEDYRAFIMQLYNGGFGPAEKLLALERWNAKLPFLKSKADLSKPFLLTDNWQGANDDVSESDITNGTILLADIGGGNFLILVVNGKEYGNIWIDDRASNDEIVPLRLENRSRVTFSVWYTTWLDNSIRFYENDYTDWVDSQNKKWRLEWLDILYLLTHKNYQIGLWIERRYPGKTGWFAWDINSYFEKLSLKENCRGQLRDGKIKKNEYEIAKSFHLALTRFVKSNRKQKEWIDAPDNFLDDQLILTQDWAEVAESGLAAWDNLKKHITNAAEQDRMIQLEKKYP